MTSRAEAERLVIIKSGSPLLRHSINQLHTKLEIAGEIKLGGERLATFAARQRRVEAKTERKKAFSAAVGHLFDGKGNEEDIVAVMLYSDEFEKTDGCPNATVIDLSDIDSVDTVFCRKK